MKTVADIMQREVETVDPDTTIREFTRFLATRGISGAPVVSEAGALLGVVSATDVIRRAADGAGLEIIGDMADPDGRVPGMYYLPEESEWASVDWDAVAVQDPMAELTVADIMTPVTFTLDPATSIRDVADFLVRGRIHRALVLDGTRMVGLVSAMDVLRAVAAGL